MSTKRVETAATSEQRPARGITCSTCAACCCRLEVMLMGEDDVPARLTAVDAWGGEVMARLDDGWCAALDRGTMLCRIYERRPTVCRDFELGGAGCLEERAKAAPVAWSHRKEDPAGGEPSGPSAAYLAGP